MLSKSSNCVKKCAFCCKNAAKYTCPHCKSCFCSSECYKCERHANCHEEFCKNWVLTHLKQTTADSDLKRKTLEILKKLHEESEKDDDDDGVDDEEFLCKLQELNLNDGNAVWNCLNDTEKQHFETLLETEKIFELIPESFWDPWYLKYKKKLVEEVDKVEENEDFAPDIPTEIKPLNTLVSQASPLVVHSIVNVVFCYCYVIRYFNGDHSHNSVDACNCLLDLSPILKRNAVFMTTREALQVSIQSLVCNSVPLSFILQLLKDTKLLIQNGKDFLLRCMNDMLELFKEAKRMKSIKQNKEKKSELLKVQKKLEFLLSFCNEKEDLLKSSELDIELEIGDTLIVQKEIKESENVKINTPKTEKPLIQEL